MSKKDRGGWKILVTLAMGYGEDGNPVKGPAIQVTYTAGVSVMFSHTLGVILDDGSFRPVQHLHDRHLEEYVLLIMDSAGAVLVARRTGIELVEANLDIFERSVRKAQKRDKNNRLMRLVEVAEGVAPNKNHPEGRREDRGKSTLRVSLGDMLKAKEHR